MFLLTILLIANFQVTLAKRVDDLEEALDIKQRLLDESEQSNLELENRLRLLEAENGDETNIRLQQQIQVRSYSGFTATNPLPLPHQ